ncbi:MAG: 1-deoxy-D-xylulose-5-phosphate synthase [Candidatus Aminicenantes bacterium 4484_214]|nr:MAG: 1-deoxy-D-xylulose-5-phosphate synthase [Candidatus Aminicenantes bacterium 4484_214]
MSVKILDSIESPLDLKSLKLSELNQLAQEIRSYIINIVSENGGHLAPNLGAVELTLALHRVFNAPQDKIIWDVGHQCYTHKIVTGRKNLFPKIRKYRGISGYPSREESEYDVYNTGHASTALSAALGMAVARDKKGQDFHVIAVVGDGSLTGGVAWEALNQIGHLRERLIIILNYNEMSISPNVGALSKYLSYLVSGQHYLRVKDTVKTILKSFPKVGWPVIKIARAVEEAVKKVFFPGLFFTELGIRYIGPVQGHNISSLIEVFEEAKKIDGPVLIHCITKKGKGYAPAEDNPEHFHGTSPFHIGTGKAKNNDNTVSYSTVFGQTMVRLAEENPKLIAITAAMKEGTGLADFSRRFPERFFDVGIAEQHAVNFATGLALEGFQPVVAIYSTFLQRAYDQLYHDVCLMDIPLLFALDRAGIVSDDGPTHQGINDLIYLRHLPQIIILAPKDENELQHMLYSALFYGHPTAIRFPKSKGYGVKLDEAWQKIPLGKGEVLREGNHLLFALGNMVRPALQAADQLAQRGFEFAVVNARFAKPIDEELLLKYALPGRMIITLEEGVVTGGFGSAVREVLDREKRFEVLFKAIGIPLNVYPVGKAQEIKALLGLDEEGICRQIINFIEEIDSGERKSR